MRVSSESLGDVIYHERFVHRDKPVSWWYSLEQDGPTCVICHPDPAGMTVFTVEVPRAAEDQAIERRRRRPRLAPGAIPCPECGNPAFSRPPEGPPWRRCTGPGACGHVWLASR